MNEAIEFINHVQVLFQDILLFQFSGKSADEIAQVLRESGYDVTILGSTGGK